MFISVYTVLSLILLILFLCGPVKYIHERQSWESSDCICISYELSLRDCLLDWLKNTGILNQVKERFSTNSQTTSNDIWTLNTNDTTKQFFR